MDLEIIGKTIAGCKITELIGRGGMGLVYRAHHIVLDQERALKVMSPHIARNEIFMKRFHAEARSLARIRSPYIVTVHDLCETEIGTCLIMEYVKSQTLGDLIKDSSGPLVEIRMFRIFKQILQAFEDAHGANVIHRDIKPGNILVSENDSVKVTDFGLAKIQESSSTTVTQLTGGTIYYMSPEQLEGLGNVDRRGDIYSIGMTLYEAVTGAVPFEKTESDFGIREKIVKGKIPAPKQRNARIPEGLNAFIMKAIARDPARRFQSASEMRIAFEKVESDYLRAVQMRKPVSRRDYGKFALPAAVTLLLIFSGYLVYKLASPPQPGILSIGTTPSNALVQVNGKDVGRSPITGLRASPGTLGVRIQRQEFESKDTTLVVSSADSLNVIFSLKRETSTITRETTAVAAKQETIAPVSRSLPTPAFLYHISSKPPGADVYVDRILQRTPSPFKLQPGRHTIRVVSGKQVWEKQIRAKAGTDERLSLDFTKVLSITVLVNEPDASGGPDSTRAVTGCKVFVDGMEVASSTPKRIQVVFGNHTITIRHPVYGEAMPITKAFETDGKERFVLRRKARS